MPVILLRPECVGCLAETEDRLYKGGETLVLLRYMYHNEFELQLILNSLCAKHRTLVTTPNDSEG